MTPNPKDGFRLDIRVRFFDSEDTLAYGSGVNQLLYLCRLHGSLRKAAEEMHMSYRKALQIIQRAEKCFSQPLLIRSIGGKTGGGSELTKFAQELVTAFNSLELELALDAQVKWSELRQHTEIDNEFLLGKE